MPGVLVLNANSGLGYQIGLGVGGGVTQATSKSTGVTLNKLTGRVTMNNAALANATSVQFTVPNSTVLANDLIIVNISGRTTSSYIVSVTAVAAGSFQVQLYNASGGSLSEAVIVHFAVIKGAIN